MLKYACPRPALVIVDTAVHGRSIALYSSIPSVVYCSCTLNVVYVVFLE